MSCERRESRRRTEEEQAEAFFTILIARYRSLRIAPGSRLLCRRSPTRKRVGSLLRSAAW